MSGLAGISSFEDFHYQLTGWIMDSAAQRGGLYSDSPKEKEAINKNRKRCIQLFIDPKNMIPFLNQIFGSKIHPRFFTESRVTEAAFTTSGRKLECDASTRIYRIIKMKMDAVEIDKNLSYLQETQNALDICRQYENELPKRERSLD